MVTASLPALATVAVAPVARGRRHGGTVMNDLGGEGGYDDDRDHDAPVAAAVGRPRCRLTDEFSGGVLSVLVCETL